MSDLELRHDEDQDKVRQSWIKFTRGTQLMCTAAKQRREESVCSLTNAIDLYRTALADNPNLSSKILWNWGLALGMLAKHYSDETAAKLLIAASGKFEASCQLKPRHTQYYKSIAKAFWTLANTAEREQSGVFYSKAEDYYGRVISNNPEDVDTLAEFADMLSAWSINKFNSQTEEHFKRCLLMYKLALEQKPHDFDIYTKWATAVSFYAEKKSGIELESLCLKVENIYRQIEQEIGSKLTKHQRTEILKQRVSNLEVWPAAADGKRADTLYANSEELLREVIGFGPKEAYLYGWLGLLLFNWSRVSAGQDGVELRSRSVQAFELAEKKEPGRSAYNLGCLYAVTNDEEQCKKWLIIAKRHNEMPDHEHLNQDADMDNVRDKSWFRILFLNDFQGCQ